MRYKDIVEWVNKEFQIFEIHDVEVVSAIRTYHSQDSIEAGACRMLIFFRNKKYSNELLDRTHYFLCFYTLKQINEHLKEGFKLYLRFDRNFILTRPTVINN